MHIRKKDLFMGLIGLSMMLGSTFSPAQLSELVDELRTCGKKGRWEMPEYRLKTPAALRCKVVAFTGN